ncbi:MAG: VPLPA-CTERM sorting domain-containing protein [Roseobacter sp.]
MKTTNIIRNAIGGAAITLGLGASAAQAGSFILDFTGTASVFNGIYDDTPVPNNLVTGTITLTDGLPVTTASGPNASDPSVTDASLSSRVSLFTDLTFSTFETETIEIEVKFGPTTTSRRSNSSGFSFGTLDVTTSDPGVAGADDTFSVFAGGVTSIGFIELLLEGDGLVGQDPSLGLSKALLQSIDASNAIETTGTLRTLNGTIDFSIDTLALRHDPTGPNMTPVPLPAGLPLLLGGMLVLGTLRAKRRSEAS